MLPILALFLVACGGEEEKSSSSTSGTTSAPAHVHTFESGWTHDADYHWHAATCGHEVVDAKAAHTSDSDGFCSVCKRYLGKSFLFADQETYYDFILDQMDMTENQVYYCRVGGGHSGHYFNLEEGDPWTSLGDALSAYTFVDGAKKAFTLDGKNAETVGDDGYIYFKLEASKLSDLDDVWFRIMENHLHSNSPAPGTLDYVGLCSVCGHYDGEPKALNADISTVIPQLRYKHFRVPAGNDKEYGIWTAFNDDVENVTTVEIFAVVNNVPTKIAFAYDYENKVFTMPENNDGYFYLVLSYEGTKATAEVEDFSVKELVHGCDNERWYYGRTSDIIDDSTDLENSEINGKYYVAFNPDDFENEEFEIQLDYNTSAGEATFKVYQDNGSAVVELEKNLDNHYVPLTPEPIIIEVESEIPGTQIDVYVHKYAK